MSFHIELKSPIVACILGTSLMFSDSNSELLVLMKQGNTSILFHSRERSPGRSTSSVVRPTRFVNLNPQQTVFMTSCSESKRTHIGSPRAGTFAVAEE